MKENLSLSPPKYLSLPLRFGYMQLLRLLTLRRAVHFQEKTFFAQAVHSCIWGLHLAVFYWKNCCFIYKGAASQMSLICPRTLRGVTESSTWVSGKFRLAAARTLVGAVWSQCLIRMNNTQILQQKTIRRVLFPLFLLPIPSVKCYQIGHNQYLLLNRKHFCGRSGLYLEWEWFKMRAGSCLQTLSLLL